MNTKLIIWKQFKKEMLHVSLYKYSEAIGKVIIWKQFTIEMLHVSLYKYSEVIGKVHMLLWLF